jgi:magnesium transporter
MQTELHRFVSTKTVEEVRKAIAAGNGKPRSNIVYVVDQADALIGTLPLLHLLSLAGTSRLSEVMNTTFVALPATLEQSEVIKAFDEHNAVELPVTSAKGRLLGRITADDVFEVMEKEYAADLAGLAGVGEDDSITDPILLTVRRRLPWLVVNLATAVLAAWVVSRFQDTIQRFVILAAYMPIIAGMGGNAATQTLGVAIRAIALGELHHLNTIRSILKEIAAGALNGFANGLLMAALAMVWTGSLKLAVIIVIALTVNLFVAGLGGVAVPIAMRKMGIDPARSATVFVTTLTDVCGFFVFLGLATIFF